MTVRLTHWRGPLQRALLLTAVAGMVPLSALASDAKATPKATTIRAAVQTAVAREVGSTPLKPSATSSRDRQANPSKESTGFFRSRAGKVALVVMVVGTGYAIYSVKHDRILSRAKK